MDENGSEADQMDEVLKIFILESREHLATIETDLLAIEDAGADIDEELVNKVFRAAHSIKGASGFFGLVKIKELAHKAENLLDMIRSRKIVPNAEVTNLLLAAFDKLREMINDIEKSESYDVEDLITSLVSMATSYLPPAQKASVTSLVTLSLPGAAEVVILPQYDVERARRDGLYVSLLDLDLLHDLEQKGINILDFFNQLPPDLEVLDCAMDYAAVGTLDDPLVNRIPLRVVIASRENPAQSGGFLSALDPSRIKVFIEPAPSTPSRSAEPAAAEPAAATAPPAPEPRAASPGTAAKTEPAPPTPETDETIRVNVTLLENLMNLAGELVLSRNQLRAAVAHNDTALLTSADQRIDQVTAELQDVIMQTRLQPIGNVFAKFPRLIRDLSRTLGKEIQLVMEGRDVALDKSMVEGLSDPLTHMIRNAVDHGVEAPDVRTRLGKKATGTVRLEARHEAGQVVVDISDDGAGIDPQRIADSAVRKGLMSAEKVRVMSDKDKQALLFLPGLSTAQVVSDVSGRGVGMDVVKTNLDRLGGQVEIMSTLGKGTTFRIKLPLTLAIMPSLLVSVAGEQFAIPQSTIEELLRIKPGEVKTRIEILGDSEVLRLRDKILPLARCADIIGALPTYRDPQKDAPEFDRRRRVADRRSPRFMPVPAAEAGMAAQADRTGAEAGGEAPARVRNERRQSPDSIIKIVVVNTGTFSFGLLVDDFHTTEEVVVKPLGSRFKRMNHYSGATILGNGALALILDVAGLASIAGLSAVSGSARAAEVALAAEAQRFQSTQSLLLFNNGPQERCAVALDLVQRIETVARSQLETIGQLRSMRYRGKSLPLVCLADVSRLAKIEDRDDLVVLVASANGRDVGLLCTLPIDTAETKVEVDQSTHRSTGVAGSLVLDEVTTLLVDLFELVDAAHPDWRTEPRRDAVSAKDVPKKDLTVLLAEDSDFFRGQLIKYLEDEGFSVLAAADGEAAWELLTANLDAVSVVVTDIEMPRLTGLELAARIRADARTAALPIIAVSSLAGEEDEARGRAAGITEYQVKLDRDRLVAGIKALLPGRESQRRPAHGG